jgi:shikimate kinase
MRYSKVVLLGFMGAGKSSVAPVLAAQVGMQWVDLDTVILKDSKFSSISEIFAAEGEEGFREREAYAVRTVASAKQLVIATGGGVIGRAENIELLKSNGGVCVFLQTSFDEIIRRLPNASGRPLLQDKERAEKLYHERQGLYLSCADITVKTDAKSVEQVSNEIAALVG